MAGPPDHRALPASSWRPQDETLGAAPRDGDFARLLEAASAPRAHRMRVDPEIEAYGPTRPRRGAARGLLPGLDRAPALPRPGRPSPAGDDGAAPGTVRDADAGARPRDEAFGGSAPRAPRAPRPGRTLRDRVVAVLFAIAGLWILLNVLDSASRPQGDDFGVLVVLAVVAFFVLRAWLRPRRPPGEPPR